MQTNPAAEPNKSSSNSSITASSILTNSQLTYAVRLTLPEQLSRQTTASTPRTPE